jgi:hypothetical protein
MRNTFDGMKKTILLIASLVCLSFAVLAQGDKEDVRIAMALLNKQKKAIISQSIPLDEAHSAGFWKLYDTYEESYNKLLTARIGYIEQYVRQYDSLNDATAATLAEQILGNTRRLDQLHESYFVRFRKAVGGTKAATLFQLEIYIQTELQYRMQKQLPLIAEKMANQ